jgi:hypothetical protein
MRLVNGIDKTTHSRLHRRLIRRHGNATKCENCRVKNKKRYEWALRKGHSYSDNPMDYIQLCTSCHRSYDFNEDIRSKLKAKKVGELHNASKLTNEQVIDIKKLLLKGVQNKVIAEKYNVHNTTISDIKRGKRWNYIKI